jgi:hypothetical protein
MVHIMENKLRTLKLKKALLLSNIESLSQVDDSLYLQFGKVEAEIIKTEKQLLRDNKNTFDEN